MAFINKKEEVIKLRLTQHGKHLLSRGQFRPDSYSFFDDDIIYDNKYAGVTEHQNASQDRIKEQPRRDTQHVSVGVETRYSLDTNVIRNDQAMADLGMVILPGGEYDNLVYENQETEKEKILGFPLSNMSLGSREVPRFEFNLFESTHLTESFHYDMLDSARIRVPQLTINPLHTLVRDTTAVDPFAEDRGDLVDSESFAVNPISDKILFADGSFFEHHPENIIFSLDEFNSTYMRENFEIEVFEIVEEKLVPIKNYGHLFDIKIDESVSEVPRKKASRVGFLN